MTLRQTDLTRDTFDFVHDISRVEDVGTLRRRVAATSEALGYPYFMFAQLLSSAAEPTQNALIGHWDRNWESRYFKNGYYRNDPILKIASRSQDPFFWSEALQRLPMNPREVQIMEEIKDFGCSEGFFAPIWNLDGSVSLVGFAGREADLSSDGRIAIHFLAVAFGGKAKQFIRNAQDDRGLTRREREIVARLARGFLQHQIADFLNISPRTVEHHVRNARVRLNVATNAQLCVEAWRRGLISL